MTIEIYPKIYLNEIPLPKNPLKALNSYIIISNDINLIIDTGFNRKECKEVLMKGIKELGIKSENTCLLVTHLHADHSGLAAELMKQGVKVYTGNIDGKMINEMTKEEYWHRFEEYKILFDLEKDNLSFDDHPGYRYCLKEPIDFTPLNEGDTLNIGEYSFEVVDIPGHTPGHIGLYERKHKLFFGGDHVLDSITPNIAFWNFDKNILSVYFNSLKKIYNYDIDYLFSSHRNIIRDHRTRISQILDHHDKRLHEIKEIIKDQKMTVRDVAKNMHWDLSYDEWKDFPNPQKWFASAEAMAHLEYLYHEGQVEKFMEDGILYYTVK